MNDYPTALVDGEEAPAEDWSWLEDDGRPDLSAYDPPEEW